MTRREELIKIVCENGNGDKTLLSPYIDNMIKLEKELAEIEKLPFYDYNPNNPKQQKVLPAFRIYKELLQQYTNCIKCLAKSCGVDGDTDESPLRQWAAKRMEVKDGR